MRDRPAEERLRCLGFGVAILCVTVQTVAHLVDISMFDRDLSPLELNTAANPFNWLPALMSLITGLSLFRRYRMRAGGRLVVAAAPLVIFFSIDDALEIHYRVPSWPIVYLPLFAIIGWALWSLANASVSPTRQMLKTGLGLLIGALLVDVIAPPILERGGWDVGAWQHELKVVLKEGTQLAGWVLVAFGAIAANLGVVGERTPGNGGRWAAPPVKRLG